MLRTLTPLIVLAATTSLAAPQRLAIQKGTNGTMRDCYIWQESPNYNGNSGTLYVGLVGTTDKRAFLQFDLSGLPAGAKVTEARLVLESTGASGVEIRVHEINAAWTETSPTWATFADSYFPEVVARFKPVAGRNFVDVTSMVQQWAGGRENNGFALEQDTLTSSSTFHSSDQAIVSLRPLLEVLYEVPGAIVTEPTVPALEAACSLAFNYPLKAHAPDATSWSIASAPEGLALDATTGELSWTPARAARGEHTFTVTASDGTRTGEIPVTVNVACNYPLHVGYGCTSAPAGVLVALASLVFLRRRRRSDVR